jgi:hypothetical protein
MIRGELKGAVQPLGIPDQTRRLFDESLAGMVEELWISRGFGPQNCRFLHTEQDFPRSCKSISKVFLGFFFPIDYLRNACA